MDLEKVRTVVERYQNMPDEDKAEVAPYVTQVNEFLARDLPALSDLDLAAVAWYVVCMMGGLMQVPLGDASGILESNSVAYAVVAAQKLGWLES